MAKLRSAAATNVGKLRGNNEDNYYVNGKYKEDNEISIDCVTDDVKRELYLYAVCDGVGGEDMGELASMVTCEALAEFQDSIDSAEPIESDEFDIGINETVLDFIRRANLLICGIRKRNNDIPIGTTLALLYIYDDKAVAINVGDSRIYIFRGGALTLLSEDHTHARRLVRLGLLKESDPDYNRHNNRLTQSLGIYPDELVIEPYSTREIEIMRDDIFLLCSDGLTDMVSDEMIVEVLSTRGIGVGGLANKLADTALINGGRDNVTAIVVKVFE